MDREIANSDAMKSFGAQIGALCVGGEVIELVGDIGAGKTTFTKGLATGMNIDDDIASPTFTISRVYENEQGLILAHYDFYRLEDAGIMSAELAESVQDANTVTVIEWGDAIAGVLPADTLRIEIRPLASDVRLLKLTAGGKKSQRIVEELQ